MQVIIERSPGGLWTKETPRVRTHGNDSLVTGTVVACVYTEHSRHWRCELATPFSEAQLAIFERGRWLVS